MKSCAALASRRSILVHTLRNWQPSLNRRHSLGFKDSRMPQFQKWTDEYAQLIWSSCLLFNQAHSTEISLSDCALNNPVAFSFSLADTNRSYFSMMCSFFTFPIIGLEAFLDNRRCFSPSHRENQTKWSDSRYSSRLMLLYHHTIIERLWPVAAKSGPSHHSIGKRTGYH